MAKKTLSGFNKDLEELRTIFSAQIAAKAISNDSPIHAIFNIALTSNNYQLFPSINMSANSTCEDYLSRWIDTYINAINNPQSIRKGEKKSISDDPAILLIVQKARNQTRSASIKQALAHNYFMQAENIQGNLLEEYINSVATHYGWLWCAGAIVRAVDFCKVNGSIFLQVKNKFNSENSSSSTIREGTEIKKWFRLNKNGTTNWSELNEIINAGIENNTNPCNMCEASYLKFVSDVVTSNREILYHGND